MTRKVVLFIAMLAFAVCVIAQTTNERQKYILIDGYFFDEMPVSRQGRKTIYMLKTPNGNAALGIELSTPLPKEVLKYAIPKEQVPEGKLLLKMFNESKARNQGISAQVVNETIVKAGDKFPTFSATDIYGRKWTNADVKGKVMVLNLWYTGCGPCCAEMPELSLWKREMPDVMFFSSTFEDAERARPVLQKQGFNWIHLVNDIQFTKFIGGNGYPMFIVVDEKGIIAKVEYGTSHIQREELKKFIQTLSNKSRL